MNNSKLFNEFIMPLHNAIGAAYRNGFEAGRKSVREEDDAAMAEALTEQRLEEINAIIGDLDPDTKEYQDLWEERESLKNA